MFHSLRIVFSNRSRLTVALMFATNAILHANWLVRLPEIQHRLGLSEGELGLSLLGMPSGAVLIMPMLGWIIARWGAGRVTFVSALIFSFTTILPSLSGSMATLILALFCIGLTTGAMDIAMNAEASAVEETQGEPIMSTCHGFWSIGGMIGAAMGGIIASWHVSLTLHMSALVAVMIILVMVRRDTLIPVHTVATPQRLFALPTGPLIGLAVMGFCVMIGEGAMVDWSAVYLKNTLGTGAAVAGFGYALFSMSMAIGRLYGDQLYARYATATIVQRSGLIAAVGLGAALLLAHPAAALIGFACAGLGFASMVPIVYRSATKAPGMLPGTGLAAVATAGYAGMFAGPPLIGFTAEAVGLGSALGIVVVLLLLVTLMAPSALKVIPQSRAGDKVVEWPGDDGNGPRRHNHTITQPAETYTGVSETQH